MRGQEKQEATDEWHQREFESFNATAQTATEAPAGETSDGGEPTVTVAEADSQEDLKLDCDPGPPAEGGVLVGEGQPESVGDPTEGSEVNPMKGSDESTSAPQDDAAEQGSTTPQALELSEVTTVLASLQERLGESQRLLGRQSDLVDKLHAENQRLRAGELRAATLPLVRDLLRLYDDIVRFSADNGDSQDLDLVKVSLLDALARNGIAAFTPEPGEQFDPKQHNVAGVLPTEDASLDRTVAEVSRVGVRWEDGQTIRVADVRVYKHTPTAQATAEPAGGHRSTNGDSQ